MRYVAHLHADECAVSPLAAARLFMLYAMDTCEIAHAMQIKEPQAARLLRQGLAHPKADKFRAEKARRTA